MQALGKTKNLWWGLLLLSVLARFYHLGSPLIDHSSWRQADTASISRNFYRGGFNLFYPQIDWRGRTPGYVESEFPLFAFLVAIAYKVFGLRESLGRLLSIVFSIAATGMLYLVAKRLFSKETAFYSTVVFSVFPSSIYFGRAFMPDFMTIFVSLTAIYFLVLWFQSDRGAYLWLSGLLFSLAFLLKISFAHLLFIAAGAFWLKYRFWFLAKASWWLFLVTTILPSLFWYYHAHQLYLGTGLTFGIWNIGSDKWGNLEIWTDPAFYNKFIFTRLAQQNLTWPGFLLFLGGLIQPFKDKRPRLCYFWLLSLILYGLVVAKGNWVHDYYQLPFLALAALTIGSLASSLFSSSGVTWKKTAVVVLLFCLPLFSFFRLRQIFRVPEWKQDYLELSKQIKENVPTQALLISIQESNDPTLLYLSDRKGWVKSAEQLPEEDWRRLADGDLLYLTGLKRDSPGSSAKDALRDFSSKVDTIFNNAKFFIGKTGRDG